ncbi:methyltransferase family protein [Sediminihabitans luteus]|uniref:Methyltransferase family protein n=1 Tax=Sediminihabitans luteus TaxID=1138585 RepID=A0A2M9D0X9_9CELL|nr:methyltransferase family protein [Sediminihabitans luteus]
MLRAIALGRTPTPGAFAVVPSPSGARQAIDLGCGAGVETSALLAAGYDVLAIDPAPGTAELLEGRAPSSDGERPESGTPRLEVRVAGFEDLGPLPDADLVHASYSLPYAPPDVFEQVWAAVRACLRPGGIVAVDLFGDRDGWAGAPGETYLRRAEVDALLDGLEVLWSEEEDAEGPCWSGTKHWHVFHVIARAVRP